MQIRHFKIPGKKTDQTEGDKPKHHMSSDSDSSQEYRVIPEAEISKDAHFFTVITRFKKTLLSMKYSLEKIADILYFSTARRLPDVFDTGILQTTVATPNIPDTPNTIANAVTATPGYDRLQANNILGRNSPRLVVINDGADILYILSSDDGESWSGNEVPLRYGEIRVFNNVFELRLRSPAITSYRATEGELVTSYSLVTAFLNRNEFDAGRTIVTPPIAVNLPNINIPDGYSLVIKAMLANAAVVYVADNAADALIPANSYSLIANEFVRLNLTNANIVWLYGAGAGDGIEYIVEV